MKVALTGWNGFLATKLRARTEIDWQESFEGSDALLLMGSPTFTHSELSIHDAQVVHQYVRETIKIVDRYPNRIIFASSTGVDDIQLDHKGSTAYNLGKLYIENYIVNNADEYTILRIGTIYSNSQADVDAMKPDRVQPRLMLKDLAGIPFEDYYLNVDTFVDVTIDKLLNPANEIVEYPLDNLTLTRLMLK